MFSSSFLFLKAYIKCHFFCWHKSFSTYYLSLGNEKDIRVNVSNKR